MRINIVGGGPGGLYFAILMKKADPRSDIRVFEQNPRGDTFGWGVVFSSQTLSALKEADPESHAEIEDLYTIWDNLDVVHQGEKISVLGNHFSGIARIRLLDILQRRCGQLGVEIHYEHAVDDLQSLGECDLLIGADGVRSVVREHYAQTFRPRVSLADNRYIWFGTPRLFHGLRLTFRPHKGGLFIAHSYKFAPDLSTFVVECDRETWKRAGLDAMDVESAIPFLERVFADDLRGAPLLSNRSSWTRFINVCCLNWFHPGVALLGDALHTAHFSIGSGTKLAMEDSIHLAGCLEEASTSEEGLKLFEARRRPYVDDFQEMAETSRHWFERAERFLDLDPLRFTYEVMTRSGRMDLEQMRKRDPEFVRRYEFEVGLKT